MYEARHYKRASDFDRYLDYLSEEFNFYKKTFSNVTFDNLFIGGGTPSLLSAEQIKRLCGLIFGSFSFNPRGRRTFECSPLSVTEEKMRVIREGGINRISLGVQSLNEKVVKLTGRPQTNKMVFEALEAIIKQNFESINVDILAGLNGETPASFRKTVLGLAKFRIRDINTYYLQPQQFYLKGQLNNDENKYLKRKELFKAALKNMAPEMKRLGYFPVYDNFSALYILEDPRGKKYIREEKNRPQDYEQVSEKPRSNLGLGKLSISHIHRVGDFRALDTSGKFDPSAPAYSLAYTSDYIPPQKKLVNKK